MHWSSGEAALTSLYRRHAMIAALDRELDLLFARAIPTPPVDWSGPAAEAYRASVGALRVELARASTAITAAVAASARLLAECEAGVR